MSNNAQYQAPPAPPAPPDQYQAPSAPSSNGISQYYHDQAQKYSYPPPQQQLYYQYPPQRYPPPYYQYPPQQYRPGPPNGLGITASILGLIGALFAGFLLIIYVDTSLYRSGIGAVYSHSGWFFLFGAIFGFFSIVFGIVGIYEFVKVHRTNAMAIFAVALGVVSFLVMLYIAVILHNVPTYF